MAIAATTWVETLGGRVRAYQLSQDMYVFGSDGLPTKIKSVQTFTPQQMYYVEFSDGSNLECDTTLCFPVKNWVQRRRHSVNKGQRNYDQYRIQKYYGPEQILENGIKHTHHNRFEFTVDTIKPLNYGYEDHTVPPFIAGMWFSKYAKNNKYKFPDELVQYVKDNVQRTKQFMVVSKKDYLQIRPSVEAMFLKDYAEIPTKEMPYKYMYGTPEQRLEFLQGFFSVRPKTYVVKNDAFKVCSRNGKYMLQMVQALCESLGIKSILKWEKPFWELCFKTRLPLLPHQKPAGRKTGEKYRQIVKVEPLNEPKPCVHIETEKPIAIGDSFIPVWYTKP